MDKVHPYGALQQKWRRARMQAFAHSFGITPKTRVLDIGGDCFNWELIEHQPRLTILNVIPPEKALPAYATWCIGDGTMLPFADNQFDVVFSNSVIEHLGTRGQQQRFAAEVRRVAPAYFVQTPNRRFPVEPHLLAPFIHFLPRRWQRPLYPVTGWGLLYKPTPREMDAQFAELCLLGREELAAMFPDANIETEVLAGMTKSLIATRRPGPSR